MGMIFFYQKIKNRVSSRLLAKIRVSQVFWEPIKNRAAQRSALLKAVYLEALLYMSKYGTSKSGQIGQFFDQHKPNAMSGILSVF